MLNCIPTQPVVASFILQPDPGPKTSKKAIQPNRIIVTQRLASCQDAWSILTIFLNLSPPKLHKDQTLFCRQTHTHILCSVFIHVLKVGMGTMSGLGLNLQPLNHHLKHPPCCFNKSNTYKPLSSSLLNFTSSFPKLGSSSKRGDFFKKVVCYAVEDATETTSQLGVIFSFKIFFSYDEPAFSCYSYYFAMD